MRSTVIIYLFLALMKPFVSTAGVVDMKGVIDNLNSIRTVEASLFQELYLPGGNESYRGDFCASSDGFFRIDYYKPEHQIVVCNTEGLYWYYPERRLLYFYGKKFNPAGIPSSTVSSFFHDNMNDYEVTRDGFSLFSFIRGITGYRFVSKRSGRGYRLWVDNGGRYIRRKHFFDETGHVYIKEDYHRHENIDGIYVPSTIEIRAAAREGIIHTVTEYRNIRINRKISPEVYKINITPDLEVRNFDDE